MVQNSRPRVRIATAMMLFMFASLLTSFSASGAYAARSICRTDPVIVLSDGTIIDITPTIQTELSNIASIEYILHVPPGVKSVAIVYTQILPRLNEKVTLVNDSPARVYTSETTVKLKDGDTVGVNILSTMHGLVWATRDGLTNSPVKIRYDAKAGKASYP